MGTTNTTSAATVPTFQLLDSAGIFAVKKGLADYYKPPSQTAPAFDPAGNTPNDLLLQNIGNAIRDCNRANMNAFQSYKSLVNIAFTVQNGAVTSIKLPFPPAYLSVNVDRFTNLWNAWNAFNDAHFGAGETVELEVFKAQNPALSSYLDGIPIPPAPVIETKVAPVPVAPPKRDAGGNLALVGDPYGDGAWFATPYANMVVPPGHKIPWPASVTGWIEFDKSPFMVKGLWFTCDDPNEFSTPQPAA